MADFLRQLLGSDCEAVISAAMQEAGAVLLPSNGGQRHHAHAQQHAHQHMQPAEQACQQAWPPPRQSSACAAGAAATDDDDDFDLDAFDWDGLDRIEQHHCQQQQAQAQAQAQGLPGGACTMAPLPVAAAGNGTPLSTLLPSNDPFVALLAQAGGWVGVQRGQQHQ